MISKHKVIESGTITTPQGFLAGAVCAGIKGQNKLDLGLIFSEVPCVAAGLFTISKIKSAPVVLSHKHLQNKKAQAVLVNSGNANASTGRPGMNDAEEMANLAARKFGISPKDVLIAGTGVIGVPLPMEKLRESLPQINLSQAGGHEVAKAMMTTDTFPKEIAVLVETESERFIIGGVAKGSGMIHPDLATMLCFLTTDADVEAGFLREALQKAVTMSFNMVSVDGETSPSDSVFILANGLAKNRRINRNNGEAFQAALNEVCLYLAKSVARDGEGATKLIEVVVEGAVNENEARRVARAISSSPLVKSAVHGSDPNWGRVMAVIGRAGIKVKESKIDLYLNQTCVMESGMPLSFDKESLRKSLDGKEVSIRLCLNLGKSKATAWGCDLSEEYVTINSAYTT